MSFNKTAIITGSNKGIGRAILDLFSNNYEMIWACSRKEDSDFIDYCKNISKEKNIIIRNLFFDFSNEKEVEINAKKIVAESDNIDVLINNAGVIETSLFQMTKIESIKNIFNINLFSQLLFTQIIIKKMVKLKKGNIINISTTSAIDSDAGRLGYSSSKAALITSSKVLSKELSPHNIRVNVIAPGLTNTDLMNNNHSKEIIENVIKKLSIKKIANPNEIANVALFLASELSSYITGQVIRVDGGM